MKYFDVTLCSACDGVIREMECSKQEFEDILCLSRRISDIKMLHDVEIVEHYTGGSCRQCKLDWEHIDEMEKELYSPQEAS